MATKANMASAEVAELGAVAYFLREMIQYRSADDGHGRGEAPFRGVRGAQPGATGQPQRLPGAALGDARRIDRSEDAESAQRQLFPRLCEPRRTAEKALAAVIQESYIQGVSTRSVHELIKATGTSGINRSQASRLCGEIDERVHAFLDRPLEEDWPHLWIDAACVKSREAGRIVSNAVIIAAAVNTEGAREVLGMATGPSEAEPFWTAFLRSLTHRGLKLVISDTHEGLKAAAAKGLSATRHRCRVHFLRNALAHAGKGQRQMVLAALNTVFTQESFETASKQWRAVADQPRGQFPKRSQLMDDAEADVLAVMSFPKAHRTQIRSTNPLARLNAEVKRRRRRGHLPQRGGYNAPGGRSAARAERRVATAAPPHGH